MNIYELFIILIFLQASLPQETFILSVSTTLFTLSVKLTSRGSSGCVVSWRAWAQHRPSRLSLLWPHSPVPACFYAALERLPSAFVRSFIFIKVYVGLSLADEEAASLHALLSVHEPIMNLLTDAQWPITDRIWQKLHIWSRSLMLICYLGSNLWAEELAAKLLVYVFIYH